MRTVMWKPFLASTLLVLGAGFLAAGAASADVTSDRPAAILVWPKLLFSSASDDILSPAGDTIDTTIQVTNTSDQEVRLRCFYVNANSHCSENPQQVCGATPDCENFCQPGWLEIDFEITLTPYQPLVWNLGDGLASLPCAVAPCLPKASGPPSRNIGSIPPANEDPFMGELKCIQVGENNEPIDRNDVKGEATIVTVRPSEEQSVDARGYNAVGIQAIEGANDGDNTLLIGEEYNGCPSVLILDHFFDDAAVPAVGNSGAEYMISKTHVTIVPCSQDFELQAPFKTTVQLLVFNEFEQRFSSSRPVTCFKEYELCALGTGRDRPFTASGFDDPNYESCQRSVFSAFVNGTLSGQTRIRGVDDGVEGRGNGLLAVAEEFHRLPSDADDVTATYSSAAFNVHYVGRRERSDVMRLP